jgi:hypothetical protein
LVAAEETVTLDPAALSVPVRALVVPTMTLPKSWAAGVTVNCPAAVPVPASAIARLPCPDREASLTLPLALPGDCGAKIVLNVKLCPAVRVRGKLNPLVLNPAPVVLALYIVKLKVEVFVSVSALVCLLPTCTLPKLPLGGLAVIPPARLPAPRNGCDWLK